MSRRHPGTWVLWTGSACSAWREPAPALPAEPGGAVDQAVDAVGPAGPTGPADHPPVGAADPEQEP